MFVLAQDGSTYVRLSFNIGPGGQVLIPTEVDYSREFGPSSHGAWDAEYVAHISATEWLNLPLLKEPKPAEASVPACTLPYDFLGEFEKMEPVQRQLILDELAERPELWDRESEVVIL